MELVVGLAVFSIVMVLVTDIFFIVTRTNRTLVLTQEVERDMRFAMESMVKEVQQGTIDYSYYSNQSPAVLLQDPVTGQVLPQSVLAVQDSTGRPVKFKFVQETGQPSRLEISRGTSGTWDSLLSDNVILVSVKFYLVPGSDPFVSNATTNQQPRVTIALSAQTKPSLGNSLPDTFFLQTTVVTRTYLR